MAPRRNNKRPKPKKNLFTPEGIPDKDFNPMAGWQESTEAENSTFNKRTIECSEQDELQANPKRILEEHLMMLMMKLIWILLRNSCLVVYQITRIHLKSPRLL